MRVRQKLISISLPEKVLGNADALANKQGLSRSEFIRHLVMDGINIINGDENKPQAS